MKRIALLATLLPAITASAQSATAFSYPGPTPGNQSFSGSLGLDFDVVSPIRVTHLLAFDDDADGWSPGSVVSVAIYDRDSATPVTPYLEFSTTAPGDPSAGSYRSLLLASSVTLAAGGRYSLVAQGFNADDLLFNAGDNGTGMPSMDDGGGLVTFTGTGRYSLALHTFPTGIDFGPENRYGAGSFIFESVPEPSAAALAATAALTLLIRRRVSDRPSLP